MRKFLFPSTIVIALLTVAIACTKSSDAPSDSISDDVKAKVKALGFGTGSLVTHEDGFMVEGDIVLTRELLNSTPGQSFLRVGSDEQYRTTNLVTGLPRVIKVSIDSRLGTTYVSALDVAISRYNAEGLRITFQRVASGADISIVRSGGNFLASAGFPTGGNPYNQIKVNSSQLSGQPVNTIASVLAHEIGHCIGFRHTDYMNRAYSCGGAATNEGASTVGAILIPGTPSGPDPNSWMLACIGSGQDRPFNANDKTALGYLYR